MIPLKEFVKIYTNHFGNKESNKLLSISNPKEKILFERLKQGADTFTISKELVDDTPSNRNFKKLKSSLFDKLLSTTLLVDAGNEIQRQKRIINKKMYAVKTLEFFGFRSVFVPVARKLITKALHFHLYHEAAELGRILSVHYAFFDDNLKEGERYHDISISSLNIYHEELKFQWAFSKIRNTFYQLSSRSDTSSIDQVLNELQNKIELGSSRLNYFYYQLQILKFEITGETHSKIETCNNAITYFQNLKFDHQIIKNLFLIELVNSYLEINDLARAELIIKSHLENSPKLDRHNYRFHDLLLKVYLYQGKKKESSEVYAYLTKNINKLTTIYDKDRFLIYSIYVGLLNNQPVNFRKINYNLNKVKQDKKGLHVPLLIGQAVYHYIHDYDKFIDKLDALKQYCYKYLKDDKYKRTNEFVRILANIGEGKNVAPELSPKENMIGGVEIVDYGILLDMIFIKSHAT